MKNGVSIMKKLLTGFIIGAITLQMAACGSATTEQVNEQTQETANQRSV